MFSVVTPPKVRITSYHPLPLDFRSQDPPPTSHPSQQEIVPPTSRKVLIPPSGSFNEKLFLSSNFLGNLDHSAFGLQMTRLTTPFLSLVMTLGTARGVSQGNIYFSLSPIWPSCNNLVPFLCLKLIITFFL